jgi:hypothetical protein
MNGMRRGCAGEGGGAPCGPRAARVALLPPLRNGLHVPALACLAMLVATRAGACPFCGSVGPSLAERRDRAAAVAVGEALGDAVAGAAGSTLQRFLVHAPLGSPAGGRRAERAVSPGAAVDARVAGRLAGTAILFGEEPAAGTEALRWSAVAADEALLGHVAAAPPIGRPAAERLRWFAGRLEHPDPAIAADAFAEFGAASFADVGAAAGAFDPVRLAAWVNEPAIDERRRGFYGLALGIVARDARDPLVRRDCLAALDRAVAAPGGDFRAGYDGVLAGLLVARGEDGLDRIEHRGLLGPRARPLDQRHLLAALRFAHESLTDAIPPARVAAATAALLASPAVAADATVDLARYRAWDRVDDVAGLWATLGGDDPLVRRAVAGYLAACPLPAAKAHLARLDRENPAQLRTALEAASFPAGR